MEPRNGYFQIHLQEGKGTFLRVFPPKAGGEQLKLVEVINYLHARNYNDVEQIKLSKALKSAPDSAFQLKLSEEIKCHEDEKLVVSISADKMTAYGRFYSPSNEGKLLEIKEIVEELIFNKVKIGIDQIEIQRYLKDRKYCTNYLLAKGEVSVQGTDAKIEYFFETDMYAKPKQNEDGSVDYHSLNMINHIQKGDIIARLYKEKQGIPGADVLGNLLKIRDVKKLQLNYGKNITLSEDGTELISDVTGHVSLLEGKVFVSNVFEVPVDVDASTGNIHYEGNVLIKGNVRGGFLVEADGDIVVNGVVEGATLIAGGNIILKRGMLGMTKGTLRAEGNILSKFLENCKVHAGGNVNSDCILHSHVAAKGEVHVAGRKGFLTGGSVKAGQLISAKIIGSSMGAETIVEVGSDPKKREEYSKLRESILQMKKEVETIKPSIINFGKRLKAGDPLSPDKMKSMKLLSQKYQAINQKIEVDENQLELLEEQLDESSTAAIQVDQAVYQGVKIVIGEEALFVKDTMKTCRFVKEEGEVKAKPYS